MNCLTYFESQPRHNYGKENGKTGREGCKDRTRANGAEGPAEKSRRTTAVGLQLRLLE